jgi:Ribosomal protein S18
MGRILPASRTGCTAKNQRKLGKAIRRARALGFMPIWSRHPQLQQSFTLEIQKESAREQFLRGANTAEFLARAQFPK